MYATQIQMYIAHFMVDETEFIGDIEEFNKSVDFTIAIKNVAIVIPKNCFVVYIDTAIGQRVYIRVKVLKRVLQKIAPCPA